MSIYVVAVFDWHSDGQGYIKLTKGNIYEVVGQTEHGWAMGIDNAGNEGYFPASYVVPCDKPDIQPKPVQPTVTTNNNNIATNVSQKVEEQPKKITNDATQNIHQPQPTNTPNVAISNISNNSNSNNNNNNNPNINVNGNANNGNPINNNNQQQQQYQQQVVQVEDIQNKSVAEVVKSENTKPIFQKSLTPPIQPVSVMNTEKESRKAASTMREGNSKEIKHAEITFDKEKKKKKSKEKEKKKRMSASSKSHHRASTDSRRKSTVARLQEFEKFNRDASDKGGPSNSVSFLQSVTVLPEVVQRYFQTTYEIFMNLQKAEGEKNLEAGHALIASLDNNKLDFLRATSAWHFQLASQWEKNYEDTNMKIEQLCNALKKLIVLQQARCYTGSDYASELEENITHITNLGFTIPRVSSKIDKLDGYVENIRKMQTDMRQYQDHIKAKLEFYRADKDGSIAAFHIVAYSLLHGIAGYSFDLVNSNSSPHSTFVEGSIRNCVVNLLSRKVGICNVELMISSIIVKVISAWRASYHSSLKTNINFSEEFSLDIAFLLVNSYSNIIKKLSINGASAFGETLVVKMVILMCLGEIDLARNIGDQLVTKLSMIDVPKNASLGEFNTFSFQNIKLHFPSRIQTKGTEEFIQHRWMQVFNIQRASSSVYEDWDEHDLICCSGWEVSAHISHRPSALNLVLSEFHHDDAAKFGVKTVTSKAMYSYLQEIGWKESNSSSTSSLNLSDLSGITAKLNNAFQILSDQSQQITKIVSELEKRKEVEKSLMLTIQNECLALQTQINKINFSAASVVNADKTATIRLNQPPPVFSAPVPTITLQTEKEEEEKTESIEEDDDEEEYEDEEYEEEDGERTESVEDGDDDEDEYEFVEND